MTNDAALLIDCPACETPNRIHLDRLGQKPRCGKCKAALEGAPIYATAPVAVSEREFDPLIRQSRLPVLVDFWAEWCGPCKHLHPILEQLAGDMSRRILILKVDTDSSRILASRYGIQAIPTLVLLRSGIEVDRITGLMPAAA